LVATGSGPFGQAIQGGHFNTEENPVTAARSSGGSSLEGLKALFIERT